MNRNYLQPVAVVPKNSPRLVQFSSTDVANASLLLYHIHLEAVLKQGRGERICLT